MGNRRCWIRWEREGTCLGRSTGLPSLVVAEEEERGDLPPRMVIVASYSLCQQLCRQETGQTGDRGSAMPCTLSTRSSLPALATAGNHQLCLSVTAALEEWRQRGKFLHWSTFLPKALCWCRDSSCWSFMEVWDLPKEAPLCTMAAVLFNHHCLSSRYRPVGKGIQFFWQGMAGFIFLYMNPHSIAICLYMVLSTEDLILTKAPGCAFTTGTNKNSDCIRYPFIKSRCCPRMLLLTVPL